MSHRPTALSGGASTKQSDTRLNHVLAAGKERDAVIATKASSIESVQQIAPTNALFGNRFSMTFAFPRFYR